MYPTVKAYFEERGYNVYAEVGTSDVVLERFGEQFTVEMKLQMSQGLCQQILDLKRLRVGNYFSVVVPRPKVARQPKHYQRLVDAGIGIYYYSEEGLEEIHAPTYFKERYLRKIRAVHKQLIGGIKSGAGETPYSLMINTVKTYMQEQNRWQTVKEIYRDCPQVSEHYRGRSKESSFRATLQASYNRDWVEIKKENHRIYFRYRQDKKSEKA